MIRFIESQYSLYLFISLCKGFLMIYMFKVLLVFIFLFINQ
jgi:hypothetical protein